MEDEAEREKALRRHILKKLYAYGAFQHGHLLKERLWRGIPAHQRGFVKSALHALEKAQLILPYTTGNGLAYRLNIERLDEIEREMFD